MNDLVWRSITRQAARRIFTEKNRLLQWCSYLRLVMVRFRSDLRYTKDMNWKEKLIERSSDIRDLIRQTQRIAVLGIKTEAQADQPAFYVPQYLVMAGFNVIPVPVYYPEVIEILGKRVYRRLTEIPGTIDLVDVFRRSKDIDGHVEEILARMPSAVWFQSGIRNDAAAETLAKAGIKVVQDRCLMVEHKRIAKG